jgi:hypothetical protein
MTAAITRPLLAIRTTQRGSDEIVRAERWDEGVFREAVSMP